MRIDRRNHRYGWSNSFPNLAKPVAVHVTVGFADARRAADEAGQGPRVVELIEHHFEKTVIGILLDHAAGRRSRRGKRNRLHIGRVQTGKKTADLVVTACVVITNGLSSRQNVSPKIIQHRGMRQKSIGLVLQSYDSHTHVIYRGSPWGRSDRTRAARIRCHIHFELEPRT